MTNNHALRHAVIDVGTNSIKFYIAERRDNGPWLTLVDRADVARLGQGLSETGKFSDQAMARAVSAIAEMTQEAGAYAVAEITAVATMGMRNAGNARKFIDDVREKCGISIAVISGEEEARLAYLAVQASLGLPDLRLVVFDSGGGSTQFTFGHGSEVDDRFSLNVGAARFTERYGLNHAITKSVVSEVLAAIQSEFKILDALPRPDVLIGMGGAVTNMISVKLAMADYDPSRVQGAILTREDIDSQIEQYRSRSAQERRAIIGLQPGREDVILAGACIVRAVQEQLGMDSLTVSDRGLRHGLLIDRFSGQRSEERL